MAVYYPADNCNNLIPEHLCDPCVAKELGGVRTVLFIESNFVFVNPSSASEWNNGILARNIIIIPETYGTFDGGAPQESQGFGDNPTSLDGYDYTINFFDPNFIGNCDFYNTIKNDRNGFNVAWRTGSQIWLSDKTVTIIPKSPVAVDVKSKVLWDVMVKWTSSELPCSYTAPAVDWRCVQVL